MRVDRAASGTSLFVDETFASFHRPGEVTTQCVWDAIAAPLAWLPPERRRRVLILGLGGGSVARLVRAMAPDAEITGVELDREVVRLARAHLDLDRLGVRVVVDDARRWLARARGRYDAILEDVFVGRGDEVHKPDWIPEPAHARALRRLAPGGVFVSNTLDEAGRVARFLGSALGPVVSIETEDYDNRVLAAADARGRRRPAFDGRALRARVAAEGLLEESLPLLRFRSWPRVGSDSSF